MMFRDMLYKKLFVVSFAICFLLSVLLSGFILPVYAAGNTTVKIDPLTQSVSKGSTFTVSIACVPNQAIKAFELQIAFNPSLLKANSVSKGNIFKSYSTFFNAGSIDNTKGTITNIYDVILGTGSTSSSGTLISISFTAKTTTGTSAISLKNVGVLNNVGYISVSLTNGSVDVTQSQQSNNPVIFDAMSPLNKSTNIPISTNTISLTIRDPEGKPFNYTIQTSPNVGSVSVRNAANGTKSCAISGLKYATTYKWYVNATDGVNWKRLWYIFTTVQDPSSNLFTFSAETPGNKTTGVPIDTSKISITIQNNQGHNFDMTITTNPDIGSNSRTNAVNGVKTFSVARLSYSTTYRWYVSCKDITNGQWTNQSYWFKTISDPTATPPTGGGGGSSSSDDTSSDVQENITCSVTPTKPEGPLFIEPGVNCYYTTSAVGLDNAVVRLRFFWGDGTYSNWTQLVPTNVKISLSHTWTNQSSYNITVIAQDEHGINSTLSEALSIAVSTIGTEEMPSAVNITTSSNNITTNETIKFIPTNSTIPGENISSYYWEFGNGHTATSMEAENIYTTPGQYLVNLTITDNSGNSYTEKMLVTVGDAALLLPQNKADFLPFLLITGGTIGIVITFIIFFILFSKELLHLPFRRYVVYILKTIRLLAQGLRKTIQMTVKMMQNLIKTIYSFLIQKKPTKATIKKAKESKIPSVSTTRYIPLVDHQTTTVDDAELAYIHNKIDQLIMDL
jgi:hypothetical protein